MTKGAPLKGYENYSYDRGTRTLRRTFSGYVVNHIEGLYRLKKAGVVHTVTAESIHKMTDPNAQANNVRKCSSSSIDIEGIKKDYLNGVKICVIMTKYDVSRTKVNDTIK